MKNSKGKEDALDDFDPILLKVAIEGAGLGTFDYDVAGNESNRNRGMLVVWAGEDG